LPETVYYGTSGIADRIRGAILRRALEKGPRPRRMDCSSCQISDLDIRLHKCPICFKWVCDECAHKSFGRMFCSKKCSEQFFFGDDDE
jgi:hypothetical protein